MTGLKLSSCGRINFSDYFEVDERVVDNYGAFNVALVNNQPLFVDPFLLYDPKVLSDVVFI